MSAYDATSSICLVSITSVTTGRLVSFLIVIVIAAVGAGALFLVFNPNKGGSTNTVTPTPSFIDQSGVPDETAVATDIPTTTPVLTSTPGNVVTTTPVVVVTPPAGWKEIDNTSQHYKAYRPGWYYRLFSPNMEILGIDPKPIPQASEYVGTIFMMRLTASNNLGAFKSSLVPGYAQSTRSINGREWTMFVGKVTATAVSTEKFVKAGYVVVSGKEYLAEIQSEASDYGGHESQYETFITTINFY